MDTSVDEPYKESSLEKTEESNIVKAKVASPVFGGAHHCIFKWYQFTRKAFYWYGFYIGKKPYFFLLVPIFICGWASLGLRRFHMEFGIDTLYAPEDSRAVREQRIIVSTFPDTSGASYCPTSINNLDLYAILIFRSLKVQAIFEENTTKELNEILNEINVRSIVYEDKKYSYRDLCAPNHQNVCSTNSFIFFNNYFRPLLFKKEVTFPFWHQSPKLDLSMCLGDVVLDKNILVSAGVLKLHLPLRHDTLEFLKASRAWEQNFLKYMQGRNFLTVDFAYSVSQSLSRELYNLPFLDTVCFIGALILLVFIACLVTTGTDCVTLRAMICLFGALMVLIASFAATGMVAFFDVPSFLLSGSVFFLTLGMGIDAMFLLMSYWSSTLATPGLSIPERMGIVFEKAGIGITLALVTHFTTFAFGMTSAFRSVQYFCILSAAAVVFCYMIIVCTFGAMLTLHSRRVFACRNAFTTRRVYRTVESLRQEGNSCLYAYMWGGQIPMSPDEDQSFCERKCRQALVKILTWTPAHLIILVLLAVLLSLSIWGCTRLRVHLDISDLIPELSYYRKFQIWNSEYFGLKIPISFVTITPKDYSNNQARRDLLDVIVTAHRDPLLDPDRENCWLVSYLTSNYVNLTNRQAFMAGLWQFLTDSEPRYHNDIVFGQNGTVITASRCQVFSKKVNSSIDKYQIMKHARQIADNSSADVFAYHSSFVFEEQYTQIMPSALQSFGITLAVLFLSTCLLLPSPVLVVLVVLQLALVLVSVCGLMTLIWQLPLNQFTLIWLFSALGFSLDSSAFVCAGYLVSQEGTRQERATEATAYASSAIVISGMCFMLSSFAFIFSETYVIRTFLIIMSLVLSLGIVSAAFLIPILLCHIGPRPKSHSVSGLSGESLGPRQKILSFSGQLGESFSLEPKPKSHSVSGQSGESFIF